MAVTQAPYRYEGFLSRILETPEVGQFADLDSIEFTTEDLARWRTEDLSFTKEWRRVPGRKIDTAEGIRLEGNFTGVLGIDALSPDDPRYWVPLSTVGLTDGRLPIDTLKYPVIEITYRCTSANAHPTWMWTYEGGSHFGALPKVREWCTVARVMQFDGFPSRVDNIVFRLYSGVRSVESFEIASVRFRAFSEKEQEALQRSHISLREGHQQKSYPVLDEFMPLGVYMDAESSRRLADMLGISLGEYLDFVTEDLVMHDCNAVFLAHSDRLTPKEWEGLFRRCRESGIRLIPRHEYPIDGDPEEQERLLDATVRPYKDAPEILARSLSGEPIEKNFLQVMDARKRFEEADPNHPVCLIARYPNAYPLYASFYAASGVGHFASRRPWDMGRMVRTHVVQAQAQQFWVAAAAFQYPTQTPEWSTCPEMRLMFNLAFANGARGWFAYSYHNDPVWLRGRVQRTLTGPFLMFSDLWEELAQRMKWADALSPLFLASEIQDSMDDWFVGAIDNDSMIRPAPGISPISTYHLRGDDFSLYFIVSNNVRDIAGVNISLPTDPGEGHRIYDLSEYLNSQTWEPMPKERHVEMFPGQAHVILVASPEKCEYWRDVITKRLIESHRRKIRYEMPLAKTYGMDTTDLEHGVDQIGNAHSPYELGTIHGVRDKIRNYLMEFEDYADPHSHILDASASICGCDGALCRLMTLGKTEQAVFLGREVVPLAAELTHFRLELQKGAGKSIREGASDLAVRARQLLGQIRSEYPGG